ncbi:MAG TPA: acyltransferase family protein [Iamia sp.]|nr:acyltransferase family protein [Iamia sp.]
MKGETYRPQLDGIRALAVVAVILYHLGYRWIPGGFVGVDVFFVLSGYLITGLLLAEAAERGTIGLGRFYARRARRLLPASLLVLVAVMIGANTLLDQVQQQTVGDDATWSALYAANWRFVSGGVDYFTPGDVPSPLQHFWSLAVEEQFYLVWPLLFLGLWRLSTRRRGVEATGSLLAAVVALMVGSALLSLDQAGTQVGYFGTHVRAHQLLAGAALAVVARRWRARIPTGAGARIAGVASTAVGLLVLARLATTLDGADAYPGRPGLVVTLASLGLIAGLDLAPAHPLTAAAGHAAPAAVGRLSYSLYLWHWPVIVFAPLVAEVHDAPWLDDRLVVVAVTVALSVASYLLVERPIRFRLVPHAPRPAVVAVGLALSVVVSIAGVPFLQPRDPFAKVALAAVEDVAPSGPCPYFREEWGPPSQSEVCVYRQGGPTTIALVGDSHAQQWQPALDRIAAAHDLTVIRLTRRGCPANDLTVQSYDDQGIVRTDVPCTIWRDRVYAAMVERYDPDVIYVETRSHDWAFEHDGRTVEADDPDHLALWAESWDPSLDVLTAGTGQVVVSETLPQMTFRVPACLAEHGEDTDACDMPLADDERVVAYNEALREVVGRRDDVTLVDPTPIVCPDGTCPALIDGRVVHRDDDHISASFARASAGAFERMLRDAGVRLPA